MGDQKSVVFTHVGEIQIHELGSWVLKLGCGF